MDDDARSDEHSVSRRTMLKRIGIVGAVAWVTPVVTSLNTPAFAASGPTGGCTCEGDVCSCQTNCHPTDFNCFCNQNVTNGVPNGKTFCTQATQCENQDCRNNSDCPAGSVCQATCCGTTKCFVVCPPTLRQAKPQRATANTSFASAPH